MCGPRHARRDPKNRRTPQQQERAGSQMPAKAPMPEDKDNEENAGAYSQQRMQQCIRHIKGSRGITKGSEVRAVENKDSYQRGEYPNFSALRRLLFSILF